MKTTATPSSKLLPDLSCVEAVETSAAETPGVVRVEIDTIRGRLALDYDAGQLSQSKAEVLLRRVASAVNQPMATCTLRIGTQGGRSCGSCAHRLETRLSKIPGIERARVSFQGGVLRVDYDDQVTSPGDVAHLVRDLGIPVAGREVLRPLDETADGEAVVPIRAWLSKDRLEIIFVVLTLIGLLGGLIASWTSTSPTIVWSFYGMAYAFGGWFGIRAGLEALRQWTVDIDLLMILAALGALAVGAPFEGAMLLFLFSLSNVLQHYAIGRSRRAIEALMKLRPDEALIRRGTQTVLVPVEDVALGDIFVVKPGGRLPLDGVVAHGTSAVDQSSLTGESIPIEKEEGDDVFGGTINGAGSLEVRVTRLARESAIARLIEMVEEAQSEKAELQRFVDRYEQPYALGVIAMTMLAIVVPLFFMGETFDTAFYRAMTLMVAASPCALVISTPAAVLSAIGNGARRGILFKGGAYVEAAGAVKAIAFDKTGTLTAGKTRLTDINVLSSQNEPTLNENDLLALAAAVQTHSEHHLARATVETAQARGLSVPKADGFQATLGKGVRALVEGRIVHIGNPRYFEDRFSEEDDRARLAVAWDEAQRLQEQGKTSTIVVQEDVQTEPTGHRTLHVLGLLAFADTLRNEAPALVQDLKALGIKHITMLTGDNRHVAEQIGRAAGIDAVYAELLPEQKVDRIRRLKTQYGAVMMVGDGINDAPALATASLGVAMGAIGTDVALETADIVLMADDLDKIAYTIALSRQTRRTLRVNLTIAMVAIVLMVVSILTTGLPLPLAVIGHEGSTVLVSLNGLRLLGFQHAVAR